MRITNLLEHKVLLEQHMTSSRKILRESCEGLSADQTRIVEGIYNEFKPLIEASLTADQVKGIFQQLEKQSVEGGANRTIAGAGVDVAKQANQVINNVGKWLQDTTPVKAFDQKFEQLKAKVAAKFPDLADKTAALGDWVKANPGKSAAVIGVLTAIASLAGGPVGGAIAGQVLKGAQELLKGEKLSTAIGKGLKAAAVGWLAGKSMEAVGKMLTAAYEYFNPLPIQGFAQFYQENIGNGLPNVFRDAHIVGTKEQLGQFNKLWGSAIKQWNNGDFEGARAVFGQAQDFASKITAETYNAMGTEDVTAPLRNLENLFSGLQAAAQGAATGATSYDKQGNPVGAERANAAKESYYVQTRPLSEGQVYMLFDRVLTEAGFIDKVKAGAGKVAGAVAKGAQWAGKQATEKVTSAKLLAAWKIAGSPTDSEELKNFLLGYGGIEAAAVDKVYSDMKIASTPATQSATSYKDVKAMIAKLDKKGRQRMTAYLQKQLGTV